MAELPEETRDPAEPWAFLRAWTPARLALGRFGASLPTGALLDFQLAHARARDAIHVALDAEALREGLAARGRAAFPVRSAAPDRRTYLLRPDLGRRLAEPPPELPGPWDLSVVLADGLSALATQRHALPLLDAVLPGLEAAGLRVAPVAVATQARVALGDEVGRALGARLVVVLIGERPGLSSPDSLGAYLTHGSRLGGTDADRNCISNIRPEGLGYAEAAARLSALCRACLDRGLSGVDLGGPDLLS